MKKEAKDNLNEFPKTCVTELSENERLLNQIDVIELEKIRELRGSK